MLFTNREQGAVGLMMIRVLFFIVALNVVHFSAFAENTEKLPDNVVAFLHDADICQYLAGEWDNELSSKRRNEIVKEENKFCLHIYERKKHLENIYKNNKVIYSKLNNYDF